MKKTVMYRTRRLGDYIVKGIFEYEYKPRVPRQELEEKARKIAEAEAKLSALEPYPWQKRKLTGPAGKYVLMAAHLGIGVSTLRKWLHQTKSSMLLEGCSEQNGESSQVPEISGETPQ